MNQKPDTKSLIIFFDFILYTDGQRYSVEDSHILFIESVQKGFAKSTLCARLSPVPGQKGLAIPDTITVQPLPFYKNLVNLLSISAFSFFKIRKCFKQTVGKTDTLWLCWPHPISFMLILKYAKTHFIFLSVRENLELVIREKYHWYNKFFGILLIKLMNTIIRFVQPQLTFFCTGSEMFALYQRNFKNVHQIKSPLISQKMKFTYSASPDKSITKLLYVGRLERVKGLPYLIAAIAILKENNNEIHLDIVGDGIEKKRLLTLIKKYQLENQICLHGYVPYGEQLFSFYRAADLFILPTLTEGFPKVIDEARAFQLPIICTLAGGIGNELRHGKNAWIIKKKSADSIVEAILTLKNNQELFKKIGKSASIDQDIDFFSKKMITVLQNS